MSFSETKLPGRYLFISGVPRETDEADGSAEIAFLYRLTRGLAEASFGVWCARWVANRGVYDINLGAPASVGGTGDEIEADGSLAGLPKSVLDNAQSRSESLKTETRHRTLSALSKRTQRLLASTRDETSTTKIMAKTAGDTLRNAELLHRSLLLAATA